MRAPIILILAAALALLLQLSLVRGSDATDPTPPLQHRSRLAAASAFDASPRAPYPLDSARSPFDPARPGSAPAGLASDSFSLIGLVRGAGSASAIVRDPAGASHVLRPGDSLQGWRLEGVGRDDVALARGSERRTLTLNGPPEVLNRTPS